MDLFDKVSEDIKNAMKAKDKVALETLRNIKKFFIEAKTAPGANDTLTDEAALVSCSISSRKLVASVVICWALTHSINRVSRLIRRICSPC